MSANTEERESLDVPPNTYNAAFTPNGQSIIYAASYGLDLGSEIGSLDLTDGRRVTWQTRPDKVFAFPTWSPDGSQLVYVLIPNSNIPFVIGELWLADTTTGQPLTLLDKVDAGHGYAPVWSPDGNSLTYVRRENPDLIQADYDPDALHSNLYQVQVTTFITTPLTSFTESLVYDPMWSPDGSQLTFTANDAVWIMTPPEPPTYISPGGVSRHPIWLSFPVP